MSVDLRLCYDPTIEVLQKDKNLGFVFNKEYTIVTYNGKDSHFNPSTTYLDPYRMGAVDKDFLDYLAKEYGVIYYTDYDFADEFCYYEKYATGAERDLLWYYMVLTTWKDYCPDGCWKSEYNLLIDLGKPIYERIDKQMDEEARERREIPCQGTTETLVETPIIYDGDGLPF